MGNAVFPSLPGKTPQVMRRPMFQTRVQRAVSGRELRASFQQHPIYQFSLSYEVLLDGQAGDDFKVLTGFFLARQGSFDSFLFVDPADSAVTDMPFGVGNGGATQFQLTRSFGGGGFTVAEPVQNVNAITAIKLNNTPTAAYSINSTGLVTFNSPPGNGVVLTWSGSFYYRCRFLADQADFNTFLQDLWELKKLEFIGAPGNKV